ncbi:hypothetical protein AYL99_11688 [Fonsecaea erecta]|uniref:Uncharacterized protein n=1 Tax=Fonsecaea erecta TaxID=1367422 RepID=A0A178Z4N7_9EURO|nr:hypothetical protein AYL99_11688 [Fonsecaea erecta]OAP54153.1 hypothetical protein AYL99_11688 [Fonsecaea erecta]
MANPPEVPETDLSALFERYPEINFDTTEDILSSSGLSENFSSPCSNVTDHDDTTISNTSTSTAHTTPLRPSLRSAKAVEFSTLNGFLEDLARAHLPVTCKEAFEGLAQAMATLGSFLVPPNAEDLGSDISCNKQQILANVRWMSDQLRQSALNVAEQINNVDFVKTRGLFTVNPSEQYLWCIYRQRCFLITMYTTSPCRTEKTTLEDLVHLFNSCVYRAFLQLLGTQNIDIDVQGAINGLYDLLMTLLHDYNRWMRGMDDIEESYMRPLMDRIRSSPEVLEEIWREESLRERVMASIRNSEAPAMQPADKRVVQDHNLSISRRRPPIPPRNKQRYGRFYPEETEIPVGTHGGGIM